MILRLCYYPLVMNAFVIHWCIFVDNFTCFGSLFRETVCQVNIFEVEIQYVHLSKKLKNHFNQLKYVVFFMEFKRKLLMYYAMTWLMITLRQRKKAVIKVKCFTLIKKNTFYNLYVHAFNNLHLRIMLKGN